MLIWWSPCCNTGSQWAVLVYTSWRSWQCEHYLIQSNIVISFNLGFMFSKPNRDNSTMTNTALWLTSTHRVALTGPGMVSWMAQGAWGSFVAWAARSPATPSSPGPNPACQTSHLFIHLAGASERGSKRKGLCRKQPDHFQVSEPNFRSQVNFI